MSEVVKYTKNMLLWQLYEQHFLPFPIYIDNIPDARNSIDAIQHKYDQPIHIS